MSVGHWRLNHVANAGAQEAEMKYGHFSEDGREYMIERPDTPGPWINYLCNRDGSYVSLLSANAGGYSFVGYPILRFRYRWHRSQP